MKILLIDNGTSLLNKLKTLIPGDEVVERFDAFHHADAAAYDLVILSGGSLFSLIGNEDKFAEEYACIRSGSKPIIGICFGFELVLTAFGGSLKKLQVKENGVKEIEIKDPRVYTKPFISVYENHEWGGDFIPETVDVLAVSAQGPEIIKHKEFPIYGMQFHPEHCVDTLEGDEVFFNIVKQIL